MNNILEDGENIEVNLDAIDADSEAVGAKEPKPSRRLLPFSLCRTVTKDISSTPVIIEIPPPSSSCLEEVVDHDDKAPEIDLNDSKRKERTRSHLYDEDLELQGSTDSDQESLVQAETIENLLGSAMRLVEQGTGENFLSLSRAPLNDAIELGRRVSTMSDIRGNFVPQSPSLLHDDDGSVHTINSQATEVSFINVPKVDPFSITQDFWEGIVRMMSSDNDEQDVPAPPNEEPEEELRTEASSLPGPNTPLQNATVSPSSNRKWDKLRNTLEAQEKGSFGFEAQVHSQRPKSKATPPRMSILHKGLRKSGKGVDKENFCMALGPIPQPKSSPDSSEQKEEKVFDVNIRVEDLSKEPHDQAWIGSLDTTVDSLDGAEPTAESSIDPDEAESMEVVYLLPDSPSEKGDILPPFPSKVFGVTF